MMITVNGHRTDAHEGGQPAACTGLAATWCPVHGDCTCPARYPHDPTSERTLTDPSCALHAPDSPHPTGDRADRYPAGLHQGDKR